MFCIDKLPAFRPEASSPTFFLSNNVTSWFNLLKKKVVEIPIIPAPTIAISVSNSYKNEKLTKFITDIKNDIYKSIFDIMDSNLEISPLFKGKIGFLGYPPGRPITFIAAFNAEGKVPRPCTASSSLISFC